MKNKNVSAFIRHWLSTAADFLSSQFDKVGTVAFWKSVFYYTFIFMGFVGSYVTLKSFDLTRPLVLSVEKPFIRAWHAFNDENYMSRAQPPKRKVSAVNTRKAQSYRHAKKPVRKNAYVASSRKSNIRKKR